MNTQELDKKYVLPTYARVEVEFVSGENARLVDSNGKKYIDFTSGIGVVSVGHANKRVNSAITKQISNITHTSNLYYIKPHVKAAQKIVDSSGYDMKCFFGNSGAEANEGAIKIARKWAGLIIAVMMERLKNIKLSLLNNLFMDVQLQL